MHEKAGFVFLVTLTLYIITLFTVSYVGVYLTYVAIPLIFLSGIIFKCTKPKLNTKQVFPKTSSSACDEVFKTANSFLSEVESVSSDFNNSLKKYNLKTSLIRERTSKQIQEINDLKLKRAVPNIHLKYANSENEKLEYIKVINEINLKISELNSEIKIIKKQCELELQIQN